MSATIKRGDRLPALHLALTGESGPVDLSAATAVRLLVAARSGTIIVDAPLGARPADGALTYPWATEDTTAAGSYRVEVEVTWPGGLKQTFPSDGYGAVRIAPDLG